MAYEQLANMAKTTLTAPYTAGGTSITVSSTTAGTVSGYTGGFPGNPTFRLGIIDQTTGLLKAVLKVTAVTDGTHWATSADSFDGNGNTGDIVTGPWVTAGMMSTLVTDMSYCGPFASRPTSTTGARQGMRYRCTDSIYEFMFDGSAWQAFVGTSPAMSLPPVASAWTTENLGTGSLTDTNLGIQHLYVTRKNAVQIGAMYKAIPSTPYTVTACFNMIAFDALAGTDSGTDFGAGIGFRSASGQWEAFYTGTAAASSYFFLNLDKYTSATTLSGARSAYSSKVAAASFAMGNLVWMRMTDDGTNLSWFYSRDGVVWVSFIAAYSRTNFLTGGPSYIGVPCYANLNGGHCNLIGWTLS